MEPTHPPRRGQTMGFTTHQPEHGNWLLRARPLPREPHPRPVAGLHALDLGRGRDGLYHIPYGYSHENGAPLLMMLHGPGGDALGAMALLIEYAEEHGIILVAPESRGPTWEFSDRDYGPDVLFLDRALERLFTLYNVDPRHVGLAGFSDGASYALSLALGNGSLFTHAIGFSPGIVALRNPHHAPRLFIAHGTLDHFNDIDSASRRIVPAVRAKGYDVTYREFEGGHSVPSDVGADALEWFMNTPSSQTM